jgi:hypothetical protein
MLSLLCNEQVARKSRQGVKVQLMRDSLLQSARSSVTTAGKPKKQQKLAENCFKFLAV